MPSEHSCGDCLAAGTVGSLLPPGVCRYVHDPYNARNESQGECRPIIVLRRPSSESCSGVGGPTSQGNSILGASSSLSTVCAEEPAINERDECGQPPCAARIASSIPRYATVQFKRSQKRYLAPFKVLVGDAVLVEGDRGFHMGTITEITKGEVVYDANSSGRIVRRATGTDVSNQDANRRLEAEMLVDIGAVAKNVRLNARVVDVEYQLDRAKLTVFVEREATTTFVDFRKLQRALFRQYRCRIWCEYVDELSCPV